MCDKPIRILQVLGGLNRGGAETMVMNLYRVIDKEQFQFDFVVHSNTENAYSEEIQKLGGKIYIFPRFKGDNIIAYRNKWKEFLSYHPEYTILHSHVRSYALVFLDIAKKYGITTIVHSHSTSNGSGCKSIVKKVLQFPLRNSADYLFACSTISGKWLFGKKALTKPNYRMIKNAIDTDLYRLDSCTRNEYRKALNVDNKVVYGHVGRLSEPKNHMFLLDVFRRICDSNKNAVLIIVGSGNLKSAINKRICELNLNNQVIMTGARDDVPCLLQAMDVFLFPSLWEGLPVTVVEAQAAGLPCLISNTVTDEVAISEAVKYLPINQGTDCWVNAALNVAGKRYDTIDKIKKAGFDVHASADELMLFYKGIIKDKG